jgi:hypothetical protein
MTMNEITLIYLLEAIDGAVHFGAHDHLFPREALFGRLMEGVSGGTNQPNVAPRGLLLRTGKKTSDQIIKSAREQWKQFNACYVTFMADKSNLLPVVQMLVDEPDRGGEEMLLAPIMVKILSMKAHKFEDETLGLELDTILLVCDLNTIRVAPNPDDEEHSFLL